MIRKFSTITLFVMVVIFSGCSGERSRVSRENNALTTAYVIKMDKNETTTEQDKRFIRAINKVAYELDRNIRGKKKADNTKNEAEALATGNGNLIGPMKLD